MRATSPSPVLNAKTTRELLWISVGFNQSGGRCDEMVSHFHICCPGYLKARALSGHLSLPTTAVGPCSWCLVATQPQQPITPKRATSSLCPLCPASPFWLYFLCSLLLPTPIIFHFATVIFTSEGPFVTTAGNWGEIWAGRLRCAQLHNGWSYCHSTRSHQQGAEGDCKHILESVIHYSHVKARWSCSSLPSWEMLFKGGKGRSFFKEHAS